MKQSLSRKTVPAARARRSNLDRRVTIEDDSERSSIALFLAATSALAISSSVNSGENNIGGLKEWNTDMEVDADYILDEAAQKLADEAAKSSTCIPIGEGENCW